MGLTKYPPQKAGRGISWFSYFFSKRDNFSCKYSREGIMLLCSETIAPNWLPLGRDSKYPSERFSANFSAIPLIMTCLSKPAQKKDKQICGFSSMALPFSLR